MSPTRRALLRASLGLAASAAAGCASPGGSNVSYPTTTTAATNRTTTTAAGNTTTATSTETTAEPTTETTTTERPTTTAVPPANPALATATANVVEEVVWFATSYRDAIAAYLTAVNRVRTVVGQLRSASGITANDIRRMESTVGRLATVARTRLQPHFPGLDARLTDPDNAYVRNVRTFARRGDWDRTKTELDRMYTFYLAVGQKNYVRQAFSIEPIRAALLDYLTAAKSPGPALFEVGYPSTRFGAFAYAGEDRHPTDEPVGSVDRNRLGSLFDALDVSVGRRDVVYVVPHVLPKSFAYAPADSLRSDPVFLQRFVGERPAADAVVSVLDGPAVQEGTETLGGTEWRRVYYYFEGDIEYAYLVRAGPFLLATGTSRTAWEERPEDWSDPLERAWLWDG